MRPCSARATFFQNPIPSALEPNHGSTRTMTPEIRWAAVSADRRQQRPASRQACACPGDGGGMRGSGEGFRPRGDRIPRRRPDPHQHGRGGARGRRSEGQHHADLRRQSRPVRFHRQREHSRSISPSQAECRRSPPRRCTITNRPTRSSTARSIWAPWWPNSSHLGLDPYPRKPGVAFDFKDPADAEMSPFAALNVMKAKE